MTDIEYNEEKFTELVLYVAHELRDDPAAGAIKLNKVLYWAEFGHVRATGRPITGAVFQKLEWGPAPRRLLPVRRALVANGEAHIMRTPYVGYMQDRLIPDRSPKTDYFTADELESIKQALTALAPYNGTEASDLSHEEIGWQLAAEGEDIPYSAAYLREPVQTRAVRAHGERLAAQLGLN